MRSRSPGRLARRTGPWRLGVALCVAVLMPACDEAGPTPACPLLGPGALTDLPVAALPRAELSAGAPLGVVGHLVAAPVFIGAPARVAVRADGARRLVAYGPRDVFGGFGHCLALATDALVFDARERGEYLLLIGAATPGAAAPLRLSVVETPTSRAPEWPPCPTLAELGCPAVRCDGELAEDADGCLTCNCKGGRLCGPERAAGPGGSCILPACACPLGEAAPVCGADGATWPSACEAACRGVPVAREGACEAVCASTLACETPCFGLRRLDPNSGCPTCTCQSAFAQDAASCAACPGDPAPVCGSDGRTWLNACRARCGGARILYAGACDPGCTRSPDGCTLDCAHGLVPAPPDVADACLVCACAAAPPLDCPSFGANACVTFGGGRIEATVGSACVAAALGADGGTWGACGVPCASDEDCAEAATGDLATCQTSGFLEGRCMLDGAGPCGCGDLIDPVCATSGATWPNLCHLRCAGESLLHLGACCDDPTPTCPEGSFPDHDPRGCPTGACADPAKAARGRGCAPNAAFAPACTLDGQRVPGSACEAASSGEIAFPEACR